MSLGIVFAIYRLECHAGTFPVDSGCDFVGRDRHGSACYAHCEESGTGSLDHSGHGSVDEYGETVVSTDGVICSLTRALAEGIFAVPDAVAPWCGWS